jgi:hypothetical protein
MGSLFVFGRSNIRRADNQLVFKDPGNLRDPTFATGTLFYKDSPFPILKHTVMHPCADRQLP